MADHSFMSQVEVLSVTDTGRRRRWTDAEKLRIVEESYAAPRVAAATARRYQISRSLLTRWRREAREGLLSATGDAKGFAPVAVTMDNDQADLRSVEADGDVSARRAEIILPNGRRLLIDAMLEGTALAHLIRILDRA